MKISIVIPVYNLVDVLPCCIESIVNQSYDNYEIVIVDDGSSDGSSELCDEYQKKNEKIHVLHQSNMGPTAARRNGVAIASGDYIMLVDGDDTLPEKTLSRINDIVSSDECDIMISGISRIDGINCTYVGNDVASGRYIEIWKNNESIKPFLTFSGKGDFGVKHFVAGKIYKKAIIEKALNKVDNNLRMLEDSLIVFAAIVYSNSVTVVDESLYNYNMREGSAIHTLHRNYLSDANNVYLSMVDLLSEKEAFSFLKLEIDRFLMWSIMRGINTYMDIDDSVIIPEYYWKDCVIPYGSKVVLYGAGKVGRSYYRQFAAEKQYDIVGWVDEKWNSLSNEKYTISSPEGIKDLQFDYVIIAQKYEDAAKKISNKLEIEIGISADKLIWKAPVCAFARYQ